MKLLLKRNQKKSMIGSQVHFTLDARAELTDEEREHVNKYRMGKTLLVSNFEDRGAGIIGLLSRFIYTRFRGTADIAIDDLVKGRQFDCHDVLELIDIERQLREASETFKTILNIAASFGGEELIEFS